MEVGDFSSIALGGGMGLFCEVSPFLSFFWFGLHFSQSMYLSLILVLDSIYFSGSELIKEGQCSNKGGPVVGVGGAAENRVSGGRIRGGGFLWAPEGAVSHTPASSVPPPPKNAVLPKSHCLHGCPQT